MSTITSVNTAPFPTADLSLSYEAAVAKKLHDVLTIEGQAALTLIDAVPVKSDLTGASLNEKV